MLPKNKIITVGVLALLVYALPALGAMPEPSRLATPDKAEPKMGLAIVSFNAIDKDANGQISKEEFSQMGMTESLFTTIDTGRDGWLSRAEVEAYGPLMTPVK